MKTDSLFRFILFLSGALLLVLLGAVFLTLFFSSIPSIKSFGFLFVFGKDWNPISKEFGALPFLIGTFLTSTAALLFSLPFSLAISILLGEYLSNPFFSAVFKSVIELLAGIPSVIYGFWGLFVLVPVVRWLELKIHVLPYGVGIFTASLVLSIMIIPYSAFLAIEILKLVPPEIKEAAYSLGATRYEVVKKVALPYSYSGIFGGILLAYGRALGETMAVTMVIGNSDFLPKSLFSPGNTIASVIANEFTEAAGRLHLSSLIELGLILFVLTAVTNILGDLIVKKMSFQES
ncbi:MAG: phosphate ABC transporter permease subunit PstC [Candidatus Eremiobacteraeota bacterium]|nr:phosphate ABC transporter permease subunit PstC [Candidatus Eremiobacteraeota bacterium]MCL5056187.1 phosphate ABC transporter permease subunit PstC [Bacillota bacterium]